MLDVGSGVPQRFMLGPILFTVCTSNIMSSLIAVCSLMIDKYIAFLEMILLMQYS